MIIQKLFRYHYDHLTFDKFSPKSDLSQGFVMRFHLMSEPDQKKKDILFERPGTLQISTRIIEKDVPSPEETAGWDHVENYRSYCKTSGLCPILEARIFLTHPDHPDWKEMTIGIPLTLLGGDVSKPEIAVVYNGLYFRILVDGEVYNEDFPCGTLNKPAGKATIKQKAFRNLQFAADVDRITRTEFERKLNKNVAYYSPPGHNTNAGDVSNFFRDGVYHAIYFLDRHHHRNRWGGGAHYFHQLTSTDLVNWIDHGPLFELTAQWESVGTGTMFFHRGKYYFAFGWHTGRVVPQERTASPMMSDYFAKHHKMHVFDYSELGDLTPSGASYAVSDDGIHFAKSGKLINVAENPSVYSNPDGSLVLYAFNGGWHADTIESDWEQLDSVFPRCGPETVMKNSAECPSCFEWNGYRYLIMGLTGFWTAKGDAPYRDSAAEGYDIYEGLCVPMVSRFKNNRMLYAGWINGLGWGSIIVHRELIQYPDGRLGIKWVDELSPAAEEREQSVPEISFVDANPFSLNVAPKTSHYYEMAVDPADGGGKLGVRFRSANNKPELDCELQLDFKSERAQWGTPGKDGFADSLPPASEAIPAYAAKSAPGAGPWNLGTKNLHFRTKNFSIAHVDVMKKPFKLRVVLRYSPKYDISLIDAEIAGQRTLISNRIGLCVGKLEIATSAPEIRVSEFAVFHYEEEQIMSDGPV